MDPQWYHTLHAMKGLFIGYLTLMSVFFVFFCFVFIFLPFPPSVVCLQLFLVLVFLSTSRLFAVF